MTDISPRLATALADRYRLERELGAGGMATVYLGYDLRHDRRVAIKVLRPELAAVIGADRFLSEIKTTANLQHPHILPLFDSGAADSFLYYVMPYVEGESLRDRLARERQLPVADAVRLATEIASALDYAHRRGVIHRDIKPENVMLHDGQALVADFGIALAMVNTAGTRMTETGMSLGTPHYMSPEQAMGQREITGRSDVYALGAITYEMLVGEPPFTGPTAQAIIARVMTEEPRGLTGQRKSIPPGVEAAVFTALEKLPADRFATAADFAAALAHPGHTAPTVATRTPRRADAPTRRQAILRVLPWAMALAAAAAAAWLALRPEPAPPVSRQRVLLWNREFPDFLIPSSIRVESRVAIAPDGGSIVFADSAGDDTQLFLKRRDEARATPIAGTEGGTGPFFSPDGEWIGYFAHGSRVRKVRVSGGGSIQLSTSGNDTYAVGEWLDDGSVVYVSASGALERVPAEGGSITTLRPANPAHRDDPATLSALPGSRGLLFTGCPGNCASGSAVYLYDIARDTTRLLVPDAVGGWYAPTGHLLYTSREGGLYAVGFDLDRMVATSGAVSITEGVAPNGFAMSASGTALLTLGTQDLSKSTLVWVARDGTEEPFAPDWTGAFEYPALAPDGRSIAVSVREAVTQLWLRRADGSRLRVSRGELGSWRPSWTPDGRAFAFTTTNAASSAAGANDVYLSPADGSRPPQLLVDLGVGVWEVEFSRDGEWLVLRADDQASFGVFHARRLRGDTSLAVVHSDSSFNTQVALSPDSRWLAFTSDRSGRSEVYVASFPDMQVRYPVSQGGGTEPRWARSGRELFFKSRGMLLSLPVAPGAGFAPGSARPLFSIAGYADAINRPQYDVGPDDRRFVMIRRPVRESGQEVVLVENFLADLAAKVRQ
ncbi:MAG TPA: protein kinase [Gemmatimonadales bacterium]|nr:protein kinase [Gemmatimonadales bacterium]